MKELIFVRHAKSDWGNEGLKDIDRCLSERGYGDVYALSKWYKENKKAPQLLISSTAVRALSTALIFMRTLELNTKFLSLEKDIYESSVETLLALIRKQPDQLQRIMLFGHNPSFTDICNVLSTEFYFDNIPTCGVVSFNVNVSAWKNIEIKTAVLNYHQFPKAHKDKI